MNEQPNRKNIAKQNAFDIFGVPSDDVSEIYGHIKMKYDPDGWILYETCREILQVNVYDEFPTELELGRFESADGHFLKIYCEIAKFATRRTVCSGCCEIMKDYTWNVDFESYREYQMQLYQCTLMKIIERMYGLKNEKPQIESISEISGIAKLP